MRCCRVVVVGMLLLAPVLSSGQDALPAKGTGKSPIPGKEAQARIESLLQELYKEDFARAEKDPALRARLAQTLLYEGKETRDNLAGRYVLFLRAHDLAAQAGDVSIALQAADELALDFDIPSTELFQMKIQMLQQASKVDQGPPDAYRAVIDRVMMMLDDTLERDDFSSSLELIAAADLAARRLRSIAQVATIRKKQDEIVRLQKEFARWQPFASRLTKNPADAEASLEMGMYVALIKGNWENGLPLLARGNKSDLQSLAKSDLDVSQKGPGRLVLAKLWFQQSARLEPAMKTQALLRASHWYQESLNVSDEKSRAEIDARLQEIAHLLPPEYRSGEITSEIKKLDVFSGPIYGCDFAPDGKRFLITGYDGPLRVFNTRTAREVRHLEGHAGKVWTVALSSDNRRAASGGFDGNLRLWDVATGRELSILEGHKDYVRSVAFSSDGQWLLSGGDDRTVRLWNLASKEPRTMIGHDHTVWSVALSRDGKRALSASLDKSVRLWDTGTGTEIKKLIGHLDTVLCVAFMPDGRHAVSGSTDKTLRLWDLDTGKTVTTFEGSEGYVHTLAVSPDGRRLLSAGQDHVLRLWDTISGKELRKLEGHRDQVWHVAFSRDGRLAISSGQDQSVRIWSGSR